MINFSVYYFILSSKVRPGHGVTTTMKPFFFLISIRINFKRILRVEFKISKKTIAAVMVF
jgi:hypothetical protein